MAKFSYEIEPTESITVRITQDDMREAERYGISHPVIYALQQATSTLWRMSDCGVALEVTPPYRSCVISSHVLNYLQEHEGDENMPPFEFELHLRNI